MIANEVKEILENADIAGYSVTNDIEIIEKEMDIAGQDWTADGRRIINAYRLWQVREPRRLTDAYHRFVGTVPPNKTAHDARDDVAMTIDIINAMHQGRTVAEPHEEAYPYMIDPAGKFRKQNGEPVYNFGPYRGLPVQNHPAYLIWMLSKSFAPSTMTAAQNLLAQFHIDNPYEDYEDYEDYDEEHDNEDEEDDDC